MAKIFWIYTENKCGITYSRIISNDFVALTTEITNSLQIKKLTFTER